MLVQVVMNRAFVREAEMPIMWLQVDVTPIRSGKEFAAVMLFDLDEVAVFVLEQVGMPPRFLRSNGIWHNDHLPAAPPIIIT